MQTVYCSGFFACYTLRRINVLLCLIFSDSKNAVPAKLQTLYIVNTFSEKIEKVSENRMNLSSSQMYGRTSRGVACPPVFILHSCLHQSGYKVYIRQNAGGEGAFGENERTDAGIQTAPVFCIFLLGFLHIYIMVS